MEADRLRLAVAVTTACMTVLGAAGLAPGAARREAGTARPPSGGPPASPLTGPRTTVLLNPGDAPSDAAGRGPAGRDSACVAELGGGPYPDEDVWVFSLPTSAALARFVAVTPRFAAPGQGRVAPAVPAEGGAIGADHGVSVAWLRLPAGWTLVGGTATIAGDADRYLLAGVCAARGSSGQLA
ncbi:hypothetical protein C5N14_01175 [Micromonospora sp. MW-13]|uniref:hypothetical protein n=1 Tax=Micromonospora sp. MW-13 TaxID=2094022 RepID=UPI000E43E502|nr:hypothetical protein [Micromonospora sp. MW-13]RGC71101.1 hypothetical protein C5N14_01175 [Micromonospora sp. MW-13]